MRVLHVAESTLGGLGRFIGSLAAHQLAAGHSVAVAAPEFEGLPVDLRDGALMCRSWPAIPQPGPQVAAELAALGRIVDDLDPDLVHLHSGKAGLVGRLLLRGRRPTIFQPHSWSFFARTGAVGALALRWERLGARWADVILCVSEDERHSGMAAGVRADYRVLVNGIDLGSELMRPRDRRQAQAQLGLDGAPLAVCVGRLHRQKNQHGLLDAWPLVLEAVPGARLELVGDGPDRLELEQRAVPGVEFAGQRDDVHMWCAAASVVVAPSRWEGSPYAVLEAMACARSLVVTDVPGMAELVIAGTGEVVPFGDRDALAAAVARRLADPGAADAEGARGRRHVQAAHDLGRQMNAIATLYEQIIARRRMGGHAADVT
jgi:glycosyltransferase involved in cell wall biosynthesis